MRISQIDLNLILKGLEESGNLPKKYALYLFGSRVKMNARGGDIDLLLLVGSEDLRPLQLKRHRLKAMAKKYIDDQKIDLTIRSFSDLETDPFLKTIKNDLSLLIAWP